MARSLNPGLAMRKLVVMSLVLSCVSSGCRLPVPAGVSEAQAQEAQDDINKAIGLLVGGLAFGLVGLLADNESSTVPDDPEQRAKDVQIKAELDADRARVRRATRLTRPKAAPRHKPLPAWF